MPGLEGRVDERGEILADGCEIVGGDVARLHVKSHGVFEVRLSTFMGDELADASLQHHRITAFEVDEARHTVLELLSDAPGMEHDHPFSRVASINGLFGRGAS